ncbi:MAG: AAA family ATPase [Rubrivivax sp.]|nr:AAA family ATPase [Rubrivivax sp.]
MPLARKDAAWLAHVALEPVSTSRALAALVWPEAGDRGALNNLRQRIFRLRKATGARLVEMADRITLADDLAVPAPESPQLLAQDPGAWDTPWLAGMDFDAEPEFAAWLAEARRRRGQRRRDELARLAADAERQGELVRALALAARLLDDEPLSEHAHRRLMRLHYLRGDTAAAVAAFERCERLLKDELGLRPEPETVALLGSIEQAAPQRLQAARRPLPVGLARPPRLVGREAALAALAQAERSGQITLLEGDAGQGKTRLLTEWLGARRDALHLQARPGDAAVPFGTLARLLRGVRAFQAEQAAQPVLSGQAVVAPERASGPRDLLADAPVPQLQAAITTLLAEAGADGLALIAVDDLHFADRASTELLFALTQSELLGGLRWVFALRPHAAHEAGAAWLTALAEAPQARWMHLPPLDTGQLAELLASVLPGQDDSAALADALLRHTGGNPLFVIETLRAALLAGMPLTGQALPRPLGLGHLIDQRLARLSPAALALARVAAIAVPDFSIELAEHALGQPALLLADAWRELEAADILCGEGFAHDLVHDAVARATPQAIARRGHRQVAAFLAARDAEPARVGWHWMRGGDGAAAARAYESAAAAAQARAGMREAAELLEQGALGAELAGDARRAFELRRRAIEPLLLSQGVDAALAAVEVLRPAAESLGTTLALAVAEVGVLKFALRWEDTIRVAQALVAAAEGHDLDAAVEGVRALAIAHAQRGDRHGALALMQSWSERASGAKQAETRVGFASEYANILMQSDRPLQALPAVQCHHDLAEAAGLHGEQAVGLMNLFALHTRRGDTAAALRAAQQADRLLSEPGQAALLWSWNRIHLAMGLAATLHYGEAIQTLEQAGAALPPRSPVACLHANFSAELWLTIGQTARAAALLPAQTDDKLPPGTRAATLLMRSRIETALGRDGEPLLQQSWEIAAQGQTHDRIRCAIERLGYERDAEAAIEAAARLQVEAADLAYHPLAALAARHRLQRATEQRRTEGLSALAQHVQDLLDRHAGWTLREPETLLALAEAWQLLADEMQARRCVDRGWRCLYQRALPELPPPFRDSYLEQVPAHRQLRALAARLGMASQG